MIPCMKNTRIVQNAPSPAEPCAGLDINPEPGQLLRSRDAADLLAISERKLWELQNAGAIPVIRLGRMVRFRRSDLDLWIASHREIGRG